MYNVESVLCAGKRDFIRDIRFIVDSEGELTGHSIEDIRYPSTEDIVDLQVGCQVIIRNKVNYVIDHYVGTYGDFLKRLDDFCQDEVVAARREYVCLPE